MNNDSLFLQSTSLTAFRKRRSILLNAIGAVAIFLAAFFLLTPSSFAQRPDSTVKTKAGSAKARRPGFDLPDSLFVAVDSIRGDIDTIIYYTAKDSTVFDVQKKNVLLTGEATLDYQQRDLKAHRIILDMTTNSLTAMSATYDSVIPNTIIHQKRIIRDTSRIKSRGAPKLMDGSTPYEGEVLTYNLQTRQGTVDLGTTSMQGGFYYGEKIKQVETGVLFVKNGRYTTCDAPTPHFYFESPRMKVVSGDQVFAEPVYLYIADVPIFALPFAVFPEHESGRHSGVIVPSYTVQDGKGFGLTHLGYYLVFSDYLDAAFRSDIYTKGGYNLSFDVAYMKRYLITSPINLSLGYSSIRYSTDQPYTEDYRLGLQIPTLRIDPVTTLTSNVNFQSSGYARNNAQNVNDILNQTATSNASFNTQFEKLGLSLGIGYSRNQQLLKNTFEETSPSITLSRISPIFLFQNSDDPSAGGILQTVSIGYSTNINRNISKTISEIPRDSLRGIRGDTSYIVRERLGILHSPSLSISPKIGYVSFTPSISYSEAWFTRSKIKTPFLKVDNFNGVPDTTVDFTTTYDYGFHRLYTYNYGVQMGTTLYGIANIGALGVKAIRHSLQPSIGFNYHPDLSSQEKRAYIDPRSHDTVSYSRYEDDNNSGIAMGGRSGTVSLSLGNDFEAKVEHQITPDSTTEDKIRLLNVSLGTGYDLVQKLWSSFSLSSSTQIGTFLNISSNAAYSFYPIKYTGADSTEHTLISLGQGILRPTNASFHIGGSFASSETSGGENYDSLKRLFHLNTPDEERQMFLGGNYPGAFVSVPFRPKWNLSYDFSYTLTYIGNVATKNFSANIPISISPTENWSFTFSAQYDLLSKQFIVPNLRVHRDLHCWELNFDYRPSGIIKGFNLEIRLKAPQLRDIKLTRQESTYGTF
jgi:hypothetical protein